MPKVIQKNESNNVYTFLKRKYRSIVSFSVSTAVYPRKIKIIPKLYFTQITVHQRDRSIVLLFPRLHRAAPKYLQDQRIAYISPLFKPPAVSSQISRQHS